MKLKWYEKGAPMPEAMGRCADLYKEVEELHREMRTETDAVGERLSELREHMIANLSKSDDTGAAGLKYRVQIKTNTKPKPEDWDQIYAYITKHARFDFLQRRLSDRAVMDVLDSGAKVPGVGRIHVPVLSITKK